MARPSAPAASDWRDGFLFIANQLALDFVNTRPVQNDEALELLTDFNAILRWFRAAGLLTSSQAAELEQKWDRSTRAHDFTNALRQWRELVRSAILVWEDTGKVRRAIVDELNQLMTDHPMFMRLKAGANGAVTELWFPAGKPEDLFAPLAQSAAALFAGSDRNRVRKCGNCVVHFYDTSKKGTRRWCSMQLCGNRLKVAAYAARNRAQS